MRGERRTRLRQDGGFTLIELLVVLAILSLLVGIAVPQVFKYLGRAKEQAAKVQIESIATGLDLFLLDVGRYPSEQEGLRALAAQPAGIDHWGGPYVGKLELLTDPWGHAYVYHQPGRSGGAYDLYTLGPNGDATGPAGRVPDRLTQRQ